MRLILFIGHHKVGSSALQAFLARNALFMLNKGVLYPAVEPQGLISMLARATRRWPSGDHGPTNYREAHNALAFRMLTEKTGAAMPPMHRSVPSANAMFRVIRQQVDMFEPHTMVLAAEVFSNFAAEAPELIDRLLDALPTHELVLMTTLRQVDDYLVSWYGQRLAFGTILKPLAKTVPRHYQRGIHFDYRLMLEPWLNACPEARLILRPYDKVVAAGGAVHDFLDQTGLPRPFAWREHNVNRGLHRGVIELARRANIALKPRDAAQVIAALRSLGQGLGLPPSPDVEMFGAPVRRRIVERFTPVHDWLTALHGKPLFPDPSLIAQERPHPESEVSRAALARLRERHDALPKVLSGFLEGLDLGPDRIAA